MDKKRTCRSKKADDSCKTSESDKSVTGIYYGKISNLINKKKIKCIYEPLDDYKESTGSLVETDSNLASGISMEVKIFNEDESSFFNQEDLSKGCIKPSSGSGNSENLGIAIGVQISPKGNSEDLKVFVEFEVVGNSTTSLTESKQYTSRMKLSEETPSKMIFNGVMKLQAKADLIQLTDIPLYIVDSKEKIVENPGFSVSYETSAKPGESLVSRLEEKNILVKLKVNKPTVKTEGKPSESSARKENKECCCNKQETKKTTISDILMCRKNKSQDCGVQDQKTETIGTSDAATQSNVNLQASKSNQTASQVSVSSGKDFESKSNQTNTAEDAKSETNIRKSVVSIKDPQTSTVSVHRLQVADDNISKFKDVANPSEAKKSEVDIELTRTESKHQRKRREGWDRLEKRRSKEDAKLTAHNTNSALRNAATQSSANQITANKEISVQYSFISPTYGIFADNNLDASSSTLTDSLVPVKSAPFGQLYPRSIESTSTQWPESLTSSDNHSQTITLVSDNEDKETDPIVVENSPEKKKLSYDGSYGFSRENPQVLNVTFATQTDMFQKPDMINTYCQYMQYPVENEIMSLDLDSEKEVNHNFKENHQTLDLLEKAKFKLGEYAEKYYYPYTPKSITNIEVNDVDSIPQSEECEEDGSFPKYIDKETDAIQCAGVKKRNVFARFINHLKPVTVAQYHTICSTANPFQLKPIPSLHDNQNSDKLELELQTLEIEKVNKKLCEEIDSLQKIYDDLNTNVSFIFENTDLLIVPPAIPKKNPEKRSIKHIESDVSTTFTELKSCLSTIDKILSTASLKSVYSTPPNTASPSREDIVAENDVALQEDIVSHEIHTTYTTVENDIKKTIKELLKESEHIKHQALLNGAPEEPDPPFFFEYVDLLKESNPLLICKSIVDDLTSKTSDTKQRKDEKEKKCESDEKPKKYRQEDKAKKSIGSCSRIKTDAEGNGRKELKLKIDNKKNDRITYFCTTFVSKVPKTSFSFGGNSRALHREKRILKKETVSDNTTTGDNVKVREEDNVELFKTCMNIMEPNLTTTKRENELGSLNLKEEVNSQNYEKNLSYSNYIAYLNGADSIDNSGRDTKNIEEIPKEPSNISDLLDGIINNEVNVLQVQESVLTEDSSNVGSEKSSEIGLKAGNSIKPPDQTKGVLPKPDMMLKSPKSFLLAESFNKMKDMPSTSTTYYRPSETTEEEQVIYEMDLTNENRRAASEIISDEPLGAKAEQCRTLPQHHRFHSIRDIPTTSSEEFVFQKNPPKHFKRSKELKMVTLKPKAETMIDSDSDETVLKMMKKHCPGNAQAFPESSCVLLRSTRAHTNVCLQDSSKSMSAASFSGSKENNSPSSFENEGKGYSDDCDDDYETDQITNTLPVRLYKSKPQLNSPEEIERIEENVRQNDMLERRNLHVFLQPASTLSICDDYSPVFTRRLLSEYSLSDSSPEIYSSDKN